MKRGEEVFFFTIIDLFAQIMFFGLLLYVVQRAKDRKDLPAGISNISVLSDSLTRLAAEAKANAAVLDSLRTLGGLPKVGKLADSAAKLAALVREQYGYPPCDGKEQYIATAIVTDESIEFTEMSRELEKLLRVDLGRDPVTVQRLKPEEFKAVFRPLTEKFPDCRYFVRLQRRNSLEIPVLAFHSVFRSELQRRALR